MKKTFKWFGIVLAGLVALLVLVGLFLPSTYAVERSLTMHAPAALIFAQVDDLKKNRAWSPWHAADKTLQVTYGERTVGVGASSHWHGESSGKGRMKVTKSVPARRIEIHLDFEEGQADSFWRFDAKGKHKTEVTWGMAGDSGWNLMGRYFGLCMDRMVGPYYEDGLRRLKKVSERLAKQEPTP
ncbi:MAG: SRPBCC family protein [Polyangiales bacterium]